MQRHVALGLVLLGIAGCSLSDPQAARDGGSAAPVVQAVASPASKISVPLDVRVSLDGQVLPLRQDIPVTLHVTPWSSVPQLLAQIEGEGVVHVVGAAAQRWDQPTKQQALTTGSTIQITGLGPGVLRGRVEARDPAGMLLYGRAATIYVLATQQGILTGTVSPSQLQAEALEQARATGAISEAEYEQQREELLYGGATEDVAEPSDQQP